MKDHIKNLYHGFFNYIISWLGKCNLKKHSQKCNQMSFLSCSQGRNAWTSIVSRNFRTSLSPAASVRSPTGPNTAACAQMNAAASRTSPRPSKWSSCVPMEQCWPGNTCGSTHASVTSPAGTPMISLLTWGLTMSTMRSWTETGKSYEHRFSTA